MNRSIRELVAVGALLGAASQGQAEFIYWTDESDNQRS